MKAAPVSLYKRTGGGRFHGPVVASTAALCVGTGIWLLLSSLPGNALPLLASLRPWNTPAHILGYLALSLLLFRFLHFYAPVGGSKHSLVLLMVVISMTFATLDEIHQIPIPNRDFDWRDLLADFTGIVTGSVLIRAFTRSPRYPAMR